MKEETFWPAKPTSTVNRSPLALVSSAKLSERRVEPDELPLAVTLAVPLATTAPSPATLAFTPSV
ncbi:hypothetical protein D3C87_1875770 [compost metagenome]